MNAQQAAGRRMHSRDRRSSLSCLHMDSRQSCQQNQPPRLHWPEESALPCLFLVLRPPKLCPRAREPARRAQKQSKRLCRPGGLTFMEPALPASPLPLPRPLAAGNKPRALLSVYDKTGLINLGKVRGGA